MKKLVMGFVAVTLVVLSLATCGGTPTPIPEAAVPTSLPTPIPATSIPSPEPTPKVLTIVTGTDIEGLDIQLAWSMPTLSVLDHVYETLFSIDTDGTVKPLLAESFTPTGDNEYTIKLRKGIKFTDGTPFNAAAVKANLERVLNPDTKAVLRLYIDMISEVRAPDDDTVVIVTKAPYIPLHSHLAVYGATSMISPAALEKGNDFLAANAVGTGPFMVKEWKKGESITLVRNDDYWGEKARLDEVVFKVVPETAARLVAVESGDADVALRVPATEADRLKANPEFQIDETPSLRTIFIFFNTTQPPFDDVRVRQAVNYGVDKQMIVDNLLGGAARVSDAPIAPPTFNHCPQTPYPRDVEKAKALLAEANVSPGIKVVLHHPTGRYAEDALVADAVRSQLKDIGLDVELKTLEWSQYSPLVAAAQDENIVQFALYGTTDPTMDPDALYTLFYKDQFTPDGYNKAFWHDSTVDAIIEKGRSNTDPSSRAADYCQAIGIIWDQAPWLWLYSEVQITVIRSGVTGFVIHPSERVVVRTTDKE
jgi:ABC-type transport system substrate-binding protein